MGNEKQPIFGDKGEIEGFTQCLTGPNKETPWKVAFYLPHPKTDEEAQARYNGTMGAIMHKGLLGIGHSIKSKDIFDIKEVKDKSGKVITPASLDENGNPTEACIKAIVELGDKLKMGRTGPTRKAQEEAALRAQAYKEAEESMLAKLGLGSMEEFDKHAAKLKK